MDRIPVTLLTGFLGSGKTTVLNRLVQQPEMADALVLINEFGEIGLDHLLVAHSREDIVVEMSSGCLCCTIRGDLVRTLKDVHWRFARDGQRQFSRVVIETTGLADPAPIVHTLATHPDLHDRYRLDGLVATIDARNAEATLDAHVESVKQAAMADRLLLTKTDLVGADVLARLDERLRAINPAADVIRVGHGELAANRILELGLFTANGKIADVERWLAEERYRGDDHGHRHDGPDHHHDHDAHAHDVNRHDDQIRAFCFTVDEPIAQRVLTDWLDVLLSLMGPSMLRIKGIVNVEGEDRPIVIHGVQHVFHPPVPLEAWPGEDRRSRVVFITRGVERETVESTFRLFQQVGAIRAQEANSA
ncbi:CobW family GTP-binding protein [Paraburkholderia unamae]|uniref:G3E family GTPase n=1 Tax=Paraburkholderia unamae TaxID=219649 RepID=A0ABX5KE47_9BURK|nr:GTP-binding protein [Paraburkholderia unamae]PVX72870.1 G3E family GTPase [Paraburkholderia unamae]